MCVCVRVDSFTGENVGFLRWFAIIMLFMRTRPILKVAIHNIIIILSVF